MRRSWRLPVLSCLIAFGFGWVMTPEMDAAVSVVPARRDSWQLPELPRKPDLVAVGLALVTSPIFEAEQQNGAAAAVAEDTRWRVAGIFGHGSERTVLISFMAKGKEPVQLRVGERLPSGHRIARVEDSAVCVLIGKKTFRLGVEYRE